MKPVDFSARIMFSSQLTDCFFLCLKFQFQILAVCLMCVLVVMTTGVAAQCDAIEACLTAQSACRTPCASKSLMDKMSCKLACKMTYKKCKKTALEIPGCGDE